MVEARAANLQPWRDSGNRLIGWQAGGTGTTAVIVFHGNAGYALHRDIFADALIQTGPADLQKVFLFEYPGYGARSGNPSESVIRSAALAAFDDLTRSGMKRIFLVGESLGSGVACAVAGARPDRVSGLLLLTPFTSLTDVARAHYPFFPIRFFLRDTYDSEAALRNYRGPVVVLVAERDTLVPPALGRRLYETYAGPKQFRMDGGRTHNELRISSTAPWWKESWSFLLAL